MMMKGIRNEIVIGHTFFSHGYSISSFKDSFPVGIIVHFPMSQWYPKSVAGSAKIGKRINMARIQGANKRRRMLSLLLQNELH